jgi:hypothetical protein
MQPILSWKSSRYLVNDSSLYTISECSLSNSREATSSPYPGPDEYKSHPHILIISSILMRYGLDGRGSIPVRSKRFVCSAQLPNRLAVHIHWVNGSLSLGVKRPGREVKHWPPSSVKVKNCGARTPLPLRLRSVKLVYWTERHCRVYMPASCNWPVLFIFSSWNFVHIFHVAMHAACPTHLCLLVYPNESLNYFSRKCMRFHKGFTCQEFRPV